MPTCWECGNEVPATLPATLRLASGAPRRFQLCPACYEAHYLPLLAENPGVTQPDPETAREESPRPRPQRRSTRTCGR